MVQSKSFLILVVVVLLCLLVVGTFVQSEHADYDEDGKVEEHEFYKAMDVSNATDDAAFTIGDIEVTEVETPKDIDLSDFVKGEAVESDAESQVDYTAIINYATKLWKFIEGRKAVSNVKNIHGNALPKGVSSAFSLSGWGTPRTRSYTIKFKNLFKMKVCELRYTVVFTPFGRYNGRGLYLDNISIIPSSVFVQWGFKLNAQVNVVSVNNRGTDSNPVAAATVELSYKLSGLNSISKTESFYVTGNGDFKWMNGR